MARNHLAVDDALRLLFPTTVLILLPVGERVPLALQPLPLAAGGSQLTLVVAIEHEDDPFITGEIGRLGAIDEEPHRRTVGIAAGCGDQDRLFGSEGVRLLSMRQEAVGLPGPEVPVKKGGTVGV